MTVRDIINGSLRLLGVLAQGEAANASEAQDALSAFNSMLDSWSTESLSVMGTTERVVTLVNPQTVYTVGPGGDIDMQRPTQITNMSVVYPNAAQPLYMPVEEISMDEYTSIVVTDFQSPIPLRYWANYGFVFIELRIYPVPQAGTQLRFYTQDTLGQIADVNTNLILAAGYEKALRYSLAVELAPEYQVEPSATVITNATLAKANIQRLNVPDLTIGCEMVTRRHAGIFNRLTGDWD